MQYMHVLGTSASNSIPSAYPSSSLSYSFVSILLILTLKHLAYPTEATLCDQMVTIEAWTGQLHAHCPDSVRVVQGRVGIA